MSSHRDWTPVLQDNGVYCSPACGGKCLRSKYEEAVQKATELAERLGPGWEPRVWENLGWHYSARSKVGDVDVRPPSHSGFWVDMHVPGLGQLHGHYEDPEEGIAELWNEAWNRVNQATTFLNQFEEEAMT